MVKMHMYVAHQQTRFVKLFVILQELKCKVC